MDKRTTLINYDICIADTAWKIDECYRQIEQLENYMKILQTKRAEVANQSEINDIETVEEDFPL